MTQFLSKIKELLQSQFVVEQLKKNVFTSGKKKTLKPKLNVALQALMWLK